MKRHPMPGAPPSGPPSSMRPLALAVALATAATVLVPAAAARATAPVAADEEPAAALGSKQRPAASCWEIKEQRPDAESGSYWLWTPQLKAADQFHCDQETDGGGWVMLGRGREGWVRSANGMGSPADVRETITGPGAFAPRALSDRVIDGLYNGQDAQGQQMRLRRALDGAGDTWQETRFKYASGMPKWSWSLAMGSDTPVSELSFDGVARPELERNINRSGNRDTTTSIYTSVNRWNYNASSWGYFNQARMTGASSSDDSYVFRSGIGVNVPFTQVYSRPKVSSSDFEIGYEQSIAAAAVMGTKLRPAASCWEIKEHRPDASSGTYWLWTPKLQIADQFYCDQETDGGGWVMLGRGREGWNRSANGMGSTADVRKTITGPGAFAPRALPDKVINGLYNGQRADGQQMRLRRAMDGAGTKWQEVRYRYAEDLPSWAWSMAMGIRPDFTPNTRRSRAFPVTDATFDGATSRGRLGHDAASFGGRNTHTSVYTEDNDRSYGGSSWAFNSRAPLPGTSSADDSYVYQSDNLIVVPFTQVFSRPKVSSSDFAAVPENGFAEKRAKASVRSGSLRNSWGVTGRSRMFRAAVDVEVQAFGEDEAANVMYVGGNFTRVQRDGSGKDEAEQEFLAAFDSVTGEWDQEFRPRLDGQVKAVEVLPSGRLAVGGDFSTADGQPHEGFVVLDKATGRVHEDFDSVIVSRLRSEAIGVWDLVVDDGWLYVGGRFTHASKPGAREVYSRGIVRLALDDLAPDRTFTQELNGTAVDLDVHRGRLYAVGTFSTNKGAEAYRALAVNIADNTQVPWKIHLSDPVSRAVVRTRMNAVVATDDAVWVTGAQHVTAAHELDDLSLIQTWIMHWPGDGQTIATNGDTVFAGCHCWEYIFEGAKDWDFHNTTTNDNHERINAIGAFDSEEGTIQRTPEVWEPAITARNGDGAWASLVDSRGTLWVGGDFTHARPEGWTSRRWTGGFIRFAKTDHDTTAPAVPANVSAVTNGTWDALSWDASAEKGITYQVFRVGSGKLMAQTTDTSVAVPAGPEGSRYLVRAVEASGNYSKTSDPVATKQGEIDPELIPEGSPNRPAQVISPRTTWNYSFDAGRPQDWPAVGTLASTGVAPLGWGTKDVVTKFPAAADGTRPLASYYAKSFEVPEGSAHKELVVTVRLDDGAAVYLNGKEVHRENLPGGKLTDRTYATKSVSGSAAPDSTTTVRVPVSELSEGTNTITAEVHSNWTKAPSSTFELEAVLR